MIAYLIRWLTMPRYHFNSDGSEKVAYRHLNRAEDVAQHMAEKTGAAFDAYQCRHCSRYHIGKRPSPFLQITRERADD